MSLESPRVSTVLTVSGNSPTHVLTCGSASVISLQLSAMVSVLPPNGDVNSHMFPSTTSGSSHQC